MYDLDSFARWLKGRRKALDLTQEVLAKRASCSVITLRRLEASDLRASIRLARSLAAALGIPEESREAFVEFARGTVQAWSPDLVGSPGSDGMQLPAAQKPPGISHLPAPLTSFVGRKWELAAVCELLAEPGIRLLTLTGPPGTGKTRVALAVAHQLEGTALFSDGAHFISLAPVADPELVPPAIAQALGIRLAPGQSVLEAVKAFLQIKHLLLVLDNFEQVTCAGPLVADLLTAAPGVKALVTSRAVLSVYGGHEFPVPPLDLPDIERLPTPLARSFFTHYSSLRLFRDRAQAVKPDFRLTPDNAADVARICAWVDGLPLAIELAAAQVKWLATRQLLSQLSNRLAVLTGGPRDLSPRQQSLAGAIDWSYDLLSPDERLLFNLLGVFVGGCHAQAVQAVLESGGDAWRLENQSPPIDVLKSLCDKSLLRYDLGPSGDGRYMMLEALREYAREKLAATGQLERARQAHADYYFQLIQAARPHLISGGEQQAWLERLELEYNNLRAALEWVLETPARAALALQFVEAMHHYWWTRGYLSEDRRRLEAVLAINEAPTVLRARVLMQLGHVVRSQGDYAQARQFYEQALAMHQQLNHELGMASAWESLAILAGTEADYARAVEMFEQALAMRRKIGAIQGLSPLLNNLAIASRRLGNLDRAEQLYRESASISREAGNTRSLGHVLYGLAEVQNSRGAHPAALALLNECLGIRHRLGDRNSLPFTLGLIGETLLYLGDGFAAALMIGACERLCDEIGLAMSPANRAEEGVLIARIRALVGDDAFSRAWAQGQTMTVDEAVAAALSKSA